MKLYLAVSLPIFIEGTENVKYSLVSMQQFYVQRVSTTLKELREL